MSQHDYNLADQAGAAFLADLNALALAIASLNSGSSEPATMFAYMLWADSGSGFLKQRNSGNTGWNIVGKLNTDMLASIQQQAFNSCAAGGSPNAITGSFSPAIATLADRMFLNVAASAANTSSIVTFTPANGVITAKDVVKGVGTALAVGDISGAGYPCVLQYNLALDKWILLNPASGVTEPVASTSPPVRQTVLSGPVDSSGYAAFGGSTGSTTVTASGTLKSTCFAGGDANRTGSIVNPSWTGLSTNGTMYLHHEIAADGSITNGASTLPWIYQWGGTPSTVNGQHTVNIQEGKVYFGNGSTATQVYRVCVGEVTVVGGVVTAITWYALMGRYDSGYFSVSAATAYSKNHNIGVTECDRTLFIADDTAGTNHRSWPIQQVAYGNYGCYQTGSSRINLTLTTAASGIGQSIAYANIASGYYRLCMNRGW